MSPFATPPLPALDRQPCGAAAVGGPAPATPAIDLAVLAQLQLLDSQGQRGLIGRVLVAYSGSLVRLMAQLAGGRSMGDLPAVRLAAHTLKSSSACVGALAMAQACAAVERAIREDLIHELPAQLDLLSAEAGRADAAVRQLQLTYPPPR